MTSLSLPRLNSIKNGACLIVMVALTSFAAGTLANEFTRKKPVLYCDALNVMRASFAFDETQECELGDAETVEQQLAQTLEGIHAITQAELNAIVEELTLFRDDYGLENSVLPFLFNSRTIHNVDRNLTLALALIEQEYAGFLTESEFSDIVANAYDVYSKQKVLAEQELGIR